MPGDVVVCAPTLKQAFVSPETAVNFVGLADIKALLSIVKSTSFAKVEAGEIQISVPE